MRSIIIYEFILSFLFALYRYSASLAEIDSRDRWESHPIRVRPILGCCQEADRFSYPVKPATRAECLCNCSRPGTLMDLGFGYFELGSLRLLLMGDI